jgi:hypothetical protein
MPALLHTPQLTQSMNLPMYSVPLAHRKTENLHIVFWLMKDVGVC